MAATEAGTGHWEAQNTTVDEVERHLGRILRELARPPAAEANGAAHHPPPRASVLTLVVHADEEGEAERAADTVMALASRHPSRTLLLVAAPDADADGLDATIRTQCGIHPSGLGHSCVEQVQLVARGATALHMASVVEPLLMSNLPAFIWWLGRPPTRHEPLLDLCDRLVVDSADFPDSPAGLAALDACTAAGESRLDLGDLNWRRIAPWCQLIAQFFDPPDARAYQRRIRRVLVEYAPAPGGGVSAAPLLLAGWLASRLDWEPESTTTARGALDILLAADRRADTGAEEVVVQLRPRKDASAEPGALLAVKLTAGASDAPATFEVHAGLSPTWAVTRAVLPGVRQVERTAPLGQLDTAELLGRELERPVADPVYADTIAMVGRLVR
jgi:glucose-6-phosphate dehydrogenase assembly protein OpcA